MSDVDAATAAKRARQHEGWIRRSDWSRSTGTPIPSNPFTRCHLPYVAHEWPGGEGPDGAMGDVWRCPECSRLWWIIDLGPHRRLHWAQVPLGRRILHWAGWWP